LYNVQTNITTILLLHPLSSRCHLLLVLPHLFFLFLLKVLLLSFSIKSLQFEISLQLLGLLTLRVSLLGLFFFVCLLEFSDGIVTSGTDFAKDFGAEMGTLDENVGQTDEVLEDWQGLGIIARGWNSHGEVDAFLWNGLFESGKSVSLSRSFEHSVTYFNG
jgi:hypothetical protein